MDLELSDEQVAVREAAAKLLEPVAGAEREVDVRSLWEELVEFGVLGSPDAGQDEAFGTVEAALVARELGAALAVAPLAGGVALRHLGTTSLAGHADRIRAERQIVAPALLEPGAGWGATPTTRLTRAADGTWSLSGRKSFIACAPLADELLVFANADGRTALALVPASAAGVQIGPQSSLERRVPVGRVSFDGVQLPADRVEAGQAAPAAAAAIFRSGAVLSAAEGNGAAGRAVELARDYADQRVQFGARIGSFQAVQHLLAEAHVLAESAWSSILFASAELDDPSRDETELATATSIAKAYTATAGRDAVQIAMQVFGGIAFTAEHSAHHYLRRVLVTTEAFGGAEYHEHLLGEALVESRRAALAGGAR